MLTPRCQLKGMLGGAREAFLRELDGYTLAECLAGAAFPSSGPRSLGAAGQQEEDKEECPPCPPTPVP